MGLRVTFSENGRALNMAIDGRFDFSLHADFRNAYRDLPKDTTYTIDLGRTTFMDSSAMGMLLLLREYAGDRDADIRLVNCSPEVRKVLSISNLDKMFQME